MRKVICVMAATLFLLTACGSSETSNEKGNTQNEDAAPLSKGDNDNKKISFGSVSTEDVTMVMWKSFSKKEKESYIKTYFKEREREADDIESYMAFLDSYDETSVYGTSDYAIDYLIVAEEELPGAKKQAQEYLDTIAIALKNKDKEQLMNIYWGIDFMATPHYDELFESADLDFDFNIKKLKAVMFTDGSNRYLFETDITYSVVYLLEKPLEVVDFAPKDVKNKKVTTDVVFEDVTKNVQGWKDHIFKLGFRDL